METKGVILQESDTTEPNPYQNHTDITSITIIGLNTTHAAHQQYVSNIILLTRNLMTQQAQGGTPTMQLSSPFMTGQTPFIVTVPAPVVNINTPIMFPSGQGMNMPIRTSGKTFYRLDSE